MEVIIKPDGAAVARLAARYYCRQLKENPAAVLGLATGSTPLALYQQLIKLSHAGEIDFGATTTYNLDEYVGLGPRHPQSYAHFMQVNLFQHLLPPPAVMHIPDGLTPDHAAHAAEYELNIEAAGGIDLQLLGLGANGHIGFNEPSSSLTSRTRIKTLTPRTIADNARFFATAAEVPKHVLTMGIGTIMQARYCLVLALGEAKAQAVAAMVEGPLTASCPASILQMHPHCTLIIDEPAAGALARTDYYRWVYDNKPSGEV